MSGYSIDPQPQTVRTDMETGTPRVRRRSAVRHDQIAVGFTLDATDMALFREWFDASGSVTHSGTAQAGGASTVTLASGASASNDAYNGSAIAITAGTGSGQVRIVSDYDGTTKVATVDSAWTTTPDSSSTYDISGGAQGGAGWFTTSLKSGSGTVSCEARFLEPWRAELVQANTWRVTSTLEVRYA
jgi:hypothetical protein